MHKQWDEERSRNIQQQKGNDLEENEDQKKCKWRQKQMTSRPKQLTIAKRIRS